MPIKLRVATFNLMNLDDRRDRRPSLEERIPILHPPGWFGWMRTSSACRRSAASTSTAAGCALMP